MARPRAFDTDAALDVLVESFWDHSFATTSTDDLCRLSGLSRSSLYNAFGTKREVYALVLQRYSDRKAAEQGALLELDLPGADLLRTFARTVLDHQWAEAERRACLGITASLETGPTGGDVTERLERNAQGFSATIAEIVARGQRDGTLDASRPATELAWVVHAMLDGLQVRSRIHHDRADVDRCVETLLDLLAPRD